MIPRLLFFTCLLTLVSLSAFAQSHAPLDQQKTLAAPDTIPFVLTKYNNIVIKAVLNGSDTVDLMFHTASQGLNLIRDAAEKVPSVAFEDMEGEGKAWGGSGEMRVSHQNDIQIGQQQWAEQPIHEDKRSGHFTDGKFGPDLFGDKVLEIDFEAGHLVVHPVEPEIPASFARHSLVEKGGMVFLKGSMDIGDGEALEGEFLLHSGYSGTILLDDEFVAAHALGEKLTVLKEGELQDAFGNVIKTKKAVLPKLSMGENLFEEIPVNFFDGAIGLQKISVMGGDLLKRFHIFLDLEQGGIFLKPNGLISQAYWES